MQCSPPGRIVSCTGGFTEWIFGRLLFCAESQGYGRIVAKMAVNRFSVIAFVDYAPQMYNSLKH